MFAIKYKLLPGATQRDWGIVYVETDSGVFPSASWEDFLLSMLLDWLSGLLYLVYPDTYFQMVKESTLPDELKSRTLHDTNVIFARFLDGGYELEITHHEPHITIRFLKGHSTSRLESLSSITIPLHSFRTTLISMSMSLLREMRDTEYDDHVADLIREIVLLTNIFDK